PSPTRHCPTAAIQQVYDPLTRTIRTAEPGDSAFLTCHCLEQSEADKSNSSQLIAGGISIDLPRVAELPPVLPITGFEIVALLPIETCPGFAPSFMRPPDCS